MIQAAPPELDNLLEAIRACLTEHFAWLSPGDITENATLLDELGLDSMHLVELQASLETRLGFEFDPLDDEMVDAFDDAGSLAAYIRQLLARP